MPVDLPKTLIDTALDKKETVSNYTPLNMPEPKQNNNTKLIIRSLFVLMAIGIFTPTFLYVYRNSSARSLTSDQQYMEDLQKLSQSRKIASEENGTSDTAPEAPQPKKENIIMVIIDNIKELLKVSTPTPTPAPAAESFSEPSPSN